MRTGSDRADDLLGLGRREDELEVRRRLLDELEQRVEALRRDHVGLIDDVDLVAAADRREEGPLPQVAGIVDATVAGSVDLDDIHAAGATAGEVLARLALAARIGDRCLLAVEGSGQDAGAGRLAAAARTAEQIGVVDPIGGKGVAQGLGDVVLTDDFGESLRSVTAIQRKRGVHGRTLTT